MSSVYKKISQKLILARKNGNDQFIKEAIVFLVKTISDEIQREHLIVPENFSLFVSDDDLLFKTSKEIMSQDGPDTTLTTTGLIDQLLEMLGVVYHEAIADELKDAIFCLHNGASDSSYANIETKKKNLSDVLDKLKLAVGR